MNSYKLSTSGTLVEPTSNLLLSHANLETYLSNLPVSVTVLPRLQTLLLRDDPTLHEIAELVIVDPALATRVMQAAGSAYIGRSHGVRSLHEALSLLGLREVYRVTAAFAMNKFLNAPLRVYGTSSLHFWRRALACALMMEAQASEQSLDENTAYTVGLLHSLGMVFIDRHVRLAGDAVTVFCESATSPLAHQEARLVGMTAPQVTAFALRRWNFSSEIADPIEFQNEPSRAGAHTPMAELLMDARFAAESIVQQMPDTLAARTVPDSAELSPIARRILALEIWAR